MQVAFEVPNDTLVELLLRDVPRKNSPVEIWLPNSFHENALPSALPRNAVAENENHQTGTSYMSDKREDAETPLYEGSVTLNPQWNFKSTEYALNLISTPSTAYPSEPVQKSDQEHIQDFTTHIRTPHQDKLQKLPANTHMQAAIEEMTEKMLTSAESVAVSRLAYISQVSTLVRDHSTVVNSILHVAEFLGVTLPVQKVIEDEIQTMDIPVTQDQSYSAHEISLIMIYIKRKLSGLRDIPVLQKEIEQLRTGWEFDKGVMTALKNRAQEAEKRPITRETSFCVLYNPSRNRYLYLKKPSASASAAPENKGAKNKSRKTAKKHPDPQPYVASTKNANSAQVFASTHDAFEFFKRATSGQKRHEIKDLHNYQIMPMRVGTKPVESQEFNEAVKKLIKRGGK